MVAAVRWSLAALALVASLTLPAAVQAQTGTITGRVVDSASRAGIPNASVVISGTTRGTLTRDDGAFTLNAVPAGSHTLRARRIGYTAAAQQVTVTAGATTDVTLAIGATGVTLAPIVTVGYGTQRREAITGSVATVDAAQANVGVVVNANQMIAGRVTGVQVTPNSGEPGAGAQIRIRGGTSINASNDPLYVIDGVPIQNASAAGGGGRFFGGLERSPLNALNPEDIESITVLKDASATAIYGSRGANGVILIQTKRGTRDRGQTEYDVYVGAATRANSLHLASGQEYRDFVTKNAATLGQNAVKNLGSANTDWEQALSRTGIATNHNLAFSGGTGQAQYRASLNYFDQQGVVIANGLKRYQARINATDETLKGHLRVALNLMASRINNKFAPTENGGGFTGGLFTNMLIYNPTFPVRDPSTTSGYYETGRGAQDVRNPVALARLLQDEVPEDRLLGNLTGTLSLVGGLSAQTTLGVDNNSATRRMFAPSISPIGAQYSGLAAQEDRNYQNLNFQQLLTYTPRFSGRNELEVVGGYEYTSVDNRGFHAETQGFITDAFGVDQLSAGNQKNSPLPWSFHSESQLASFFTRMNYGWADRYFLTGVLRYDGSSRLAPGHQWATFPAISASWRISDESFMRDRSPALSTLKLRVGYGKQGNQAVAPYQTQLLLRSDPGTAYPFGGVVTAGIRAAQVGNPNLKWETSTQTNVGVDYGFLNDRVTGSVDVYNKNTKDLLLDVSVPQPAVVSSRIENVGSLRNRGVEASLDAQLVNGARHSLSGGLVFTLERTRVLSLGGSRKFINTGFVFGQGQSGQYSQRIMVGEPIGTFYAPTFLRVNGEGKQVFACTAKNTSCANGETTDPTDEDRKIVGNANPNFTLGLRNNGNWGNVDASWLWRGEFGGKVFNNTALVYQTKSDATQGRNFLRAALTMPDAITEPAKFSSRWIEDRTFTRLQNVTIGYTFPTSSRLLGTLGSRSTRVYVSGDNLLLFTKYSGYDPEVFVASGLASRGIDYVTYPRARTFTAGARIQF